MKRIVILIFFCFSCNSYTQSIMSYLDFGANNDFRSAQLVAETTIYRTFYNSKNSEKKKEVSTYNFQNNKTTENRYDENDILKQRLTRVYDSTGTRSMFSKLENWHPIVGHFYDTFFYKYDANGFLSRIVEKDGNNNIIRQTSIINNEKGHPIALAIYIGDKMQSREVAEYDYENNDVLIHYFNRENVLLNSVNSKITHDKIEHGDEVNEYGDIIKSAKYEESIKYDKFGNWIKKVYSFLDNGKLTKKSETVRVIKYRK